MFLMRLHSQATCFFMGLQENGEICQRQTFKKLMSSWAGQSFGVFFNTELERADARTRTLGSNSFLTRFASLLHDSLTHSLVWHRADNISQAWQSAGIMCLCKTSSSTMATNKPSGNSSNGDRVRLTSSDSSRFSEIPCNSHGPRALKMHRLMVRH
jgi:hypothetical protein